MKNLAKQLEKEVLKRKNEKLTSIKQIQTNEAKKLDWYLLELLPASKKNYVFASVKECKDYLIKRLEIHTSKKLDNNISLLNFNPNLPQIESFTIEVSWRKNSTWGANPTAEAYVNGIGFVSSGSVSGCGYDKQSTAVAGVLNQVPQFKKLMFELKNKTKNANLKNHEVFGYGSGYGILPSFEGGVGVSCYDRIFNKIGYKFETIASGKSFDVFKITKIK
jgi:hypothetical protein